MRPFSCLAKVDRERSLHIKYCQIIDFFYLFQIATKWMDALLSWNSRLAGFQKLQTTNASDCKCKLRSAISNLQAQICKFKSASSNLHALFLLICRFEWVKVSNPVNSWQGQNLYHRPCLELDKWGLALVLNRKRFWIVAVKQPWTNHRTLAKTQIRIPTSLHGLYLAKYS